MYHVLFYFEKSAPSLNMTLFKTTEEELN